MTDHLLVRKTELLACARLSVDGTMGTMNADEKALIPKVQERLHALFAELRELQGGHMTVDEFAALAGANRNAASNWLNGYNLPPVWRMMTLCDQIGLTLDWIYRGDSNGLSMEKTIRLNGRVGASGALPEGAAPAVSAVELEPPASARKTRKARRKTETTYSIPPAKVT